MTTMTKREFERRQHLTRTLQALGFTEQEVESLRRISNTLQRWHELECGAGEGQVTRSVERENPDGTGRPFLRVQYPTRTGYVDRRTPIADREAGAKKRLAAILSRVNESRYVGDTASIHAPNCDDLQAFIQTDPRGAALYIIRPGDVPAGADVSAYYTRGICVY